MIVPMQELNDYTMRIDIEGMANTLRIYWVEFSATIKPEMETNGFWLMDIKNKLFDIKGIKLVGGCELMWPYSQINFGGFYLVDTTGANLDPQFEGVTDVWQLNYISAANVEAFREALNLETI